MLSCNAISDLPYIEAVMYTGYIERVCVTCFSKHQRIEYASCKLPGWAKRSCCRFHSGEPMNGNRIRREYLEVGKQYTNGGRKRIWDGNNWTCVHHNKKPSSCLEGSCAVTKKRKVETSDAQARSPKRGTGKYVTDLF